MEHKMDDYDDLDPRKLNEKDYIDDEEYSNYVGSRDIVKKYPNEISQVIALLYESLLAKVNRKMNMNLLRAIRYKIGLVEYGQKIGSYYLFYKASVLLKTLSKTQSIIEKFKMTLEEIINKTQDFLDIYNDLNDITKLNADDLANFCKEMALIEKDFISFKFNELQRSQAHDKLIGDYTKLFLDKNLGYMGKESNVNLIDAVNYLKCVY